jgi:hypothetical protein
MCIGIWTIIFAFTYFRSDKLLNRNDPFISQVDESIVMED